MWELFAGEALFDGVGTHNGNLSLLCRVAIAATYVFGTALIVMTAISLASMIFTGSPFIATPKKLARQIVLGPDQTARLQKRLRQLKKGCRILSRRFEIPGWPLTQRVTLKKRFGEDMVFLYTV